MSLYTENYRSAHKDLIPLSKDTLIQRILDLEKKPHLLNEKALKPDEVAKIAGYRKSWHVKRSPRRRVPNSCKKEHLII